ncbi:MAG: GDP-L-fucose synthase [Ideonella sp.]|nr:GDP-L-fucose synthase [Ideonella sp.]MCC7457878.1 GDP-L-fucose synthase [Nitrospira sp.]
MLFDNPDAPIYVAGHRGMVGSALVRALAARGHRGIVTRAREQLDLLDAGAVDAFLRAQRPAYVFVAAARVGGIAANQGEPADFLHQNLQIALNVIAGAHRAGVQRLMYFASNCIYPRDCAQPMAESALLGGPPEPSNEAYAIAKIAGLKLCEAYQRQHGREYITVLPASLYGPNDNYDPQRSHVLPALLRRAHEARERGDPQLVVWGSGTPRRELLYVDDLAQACMMLAASGYAGPPLNIGSGTDSSIRELAEAVAETVGYGGRLVFDTTKPDGTPRKLLDSTRIRAFGWQPTIGLRDGLRRAYAAAPWQHSTAADPCSIGREAATAGATR